jgi:hypothetical protein
MANKSGSPALAGRGTTNLQPKPTFLARPTDVTFFIFYVLLFLLVLHQI